MWRLFADFKGVAKCVRTQNQTYIQNYEKTKIVSCPRYRKKNEPNMCTG